MTLFREVIVLGTDSTAAKFYWINIVREKLFMRKIRMIAHE